MNNKNHESMSLFKFLMSEAVRSNVFGVLIGIVIAVIGALFNENKNISIIIQFIGAIIAFASTEQIIKKMPKN